MKMHIQQVLTASVVLNIGLVLSAVYGKLSPASEAARNSDDANVVSTAHFVSAPHVLGDSQSKADILLDIENDALAEVRQLAQQYWRTDGNYETQYGDAISTAQQEIRDGLLTALGEEASQDPLFRRYFRPMDPMYAFLSSDQQLSIQLLKSERDKQLRTAIRQGDPGGFLAGANAIEPKAVETINKGFQADLASLLDESTLFEFLLRDSPTAQQLRASGVELTQDEFREIFSVLSILQASPVDIEAVLAARNELRQILGSRRFAAFWSARDPTFSSVQDVVTKNGLDGRTADAIYEILNDFQDKRIRAATLAEHQPDRVAAESVRLAEEEENSIARLVGDQIAAEILRSRALQSYRLFGGTSPAENSQTTTLRVR